MPVNTKTTKMPWFPVFTADEHKASDGSKKKWTRADLNSVVANHQAQTAPLVIGHPKGDAPAYGWVSDLRVNGDVLEAQANNVNPQFAAAVTGRAFPNKSVSLVPDGSGGWKLAHIGYLGAAAPALKNLPWQDFEQNPAILEQAHTYEYTATSEAATYEFSDGATDAETISLSLVKTIAEGFAKFFSAGTATATPANPTSSPTPGTPERSGTGDTPTDTPTDKPKQEKDSTVPDDKKTARETELEKRIAELEKSQQSSDHSARVSQMQHYIDATLNGGTAPRITQTDGLAEFMAALPDAEAVNFSESGDAQTPLAYIKNLFESLPAQDGLTRDFSAAEPASNNPQSLAAKAKKYQSEQAKNGFTVSLTDAMEHVTNASK